MRLQHLLNRQLTCGYLNLLLWKGFQHLPKKVRKTEIMEGEFRRLIGQFTQFLSSGRCEIVPIDDEVREAARTILGTWALTHKLGSLDALQLGAALRVKEVVGPLDFYSSDRRLLAAAQAQGFTVKNPGVA